jgi:hypothetical protein
MAKNTAVYGLYKDRKGVDEAVETREQGTAPGPLSVWASS